MKRKHLLLTGLLVVSLMFCLLLAGCGGSQKTAPGQPEEPSGQAEQEKIVLKFAQHTAQTFPYYDGAAKFKELIEAKTNGKVEVQIFTGGQLGGERDINEGILEGTIQLGVGAGALGTLAPIVNILELPFLITGQEHMAKIAEGPAGEALAKKIEEQAGFRVLGWFSTGDSGLQTKDVSVTTPADLKGQKLRVMEIPVLVDAVSAIGATPTPMPYPEIYTGLKQGVITGATVDVMSVETLKLNEVVNNMTDPRHAAFLAEPRPVIMSAKYFDSLPTDIQEAIKECMLEAASYERQVFVEKQAAILKSLEEGGFNLTKIDVDAFKEKLVPVTEKWAKELEAEEIIQLIQEAQ